MRLVDADMASAYLNMIACEQIHNMPTIDAEPVRYGKWKYDVVCSECGFYRQTTRSDNLMIGNYCPNCGAKMKGD